MPLVMPLQRAATEAATDASEAEMPTGSPPQPITEPEEPAAGQPGLEGLDLERLADEVYAIIEQRLTIERESLGI